jgi:hypothetical protein
MSGTAEQETIALTDFTAEVAFFRRASRIDQELRDTAIHRFIGDKGPQLIEGPALLSVPLCLSNMCPLANAGQIFQSQAALRLNGLVDKASGNDVTTLPDESGSFSGHV